MRINEIFVSLSGELDGFGLQGSLTTFVRLQGCNLDCSWCDTDYAAIGDGGEDMAWETVAVQCKTNHVLITGGEPLLQATELVPLINNLLDNQYIITIETNGSLRPPTIAMPYKVPYLKPLRYVVDYKLPSSGMMRHMKEEVFASLTCFDVIKFVVADEEDYHIAKELLLQNPSWQARIAISPVLTGSGLGWAQTLAQHLVDDKLEAVHFSLQLHKLLRVQ